MNKNSVIVAHPCAILEPYNLHVERVRGDIAQNVHAALFRLFSSFKNTLKKSFLSKSI